MRHDLPNILQLHTGRSDERMFNSADRLADDMKVMLDEEIYAEQHRTCQCVLDRYNSITRRTGQYGIEDLLEARAWKQLCIQPQQFP